MRSNLREEGWLLAHVLRGDMAPVWPKYVMSVCYVLVDQETRLSWEVELGDSNSQSVKPK